MVPSPIRFPNEMPPASSGGFVSSSISAVDLGQPLAQPRLDCLQIELCGYFVALNSMDVGLAAVLAEGELHRPGDLVLGRFADHVELTVCERVVRLAGSDGAELAVALDAEVALELRLGGAPGRACSTDRCTEAS